MCEYCNEYKDTKHEYMYMDNLPILDDYEEKLITGFHRQYQYIRKSIKQKSYNLITELNDEDGNVLNLPINYCPMCGRKLGE